MARITKKHITVLFITIISMLLLLSGCSEITENITPEIEAAVADAILSENEADYYGECPAEGHIIFATETKNNTIYAYTYISNVAFGFENGNFVDISGAQLPAVFEFNADNYELIKVLYPDDGAFYASSIKKMFPKKYESKVLNLSDADYENLNNQLDKYAENYLKSIGRTADIGRMSDYDYVLPTDLGISTEVSNSLNYIENLSPYPYWIGDKEVIENGTRYVYKTEYDEENNLIIYSKYEYDTPENVEEKIIVNSLTGKIVE